MGKVTLPCFISLPEANVLSFIKIDFTLGTRPKHQEYHKKLKGKKLMRPIHQSSWNSYIGGYQYLYSLSLEIIFFFRHLRVTVIRTWPLRCKTTASSLTGVVMFYWNLCIAQKTSWSSWKRTSKENQLNSCNMALSQRLTWSNICYRSYSTILMYVMHTYLYPFHNIPDVKLRTPGRHPKLCSVIFFLVAALLQQTTHRCLLEIEKANFGVNSMGNITIWHVFENKFFVSIDSLPIRERRKQLAYVIPTCFSMLVCSK